MKSIVILIIIALLIFGCSESLTNSDMRQELVPVPDNWAALYGDDFESQQTANIALTIQTINKQAKVIQQLDSRLVVLEDPNNSLLESLEDRVSKLEDTTVKEYDPNEWTFINKMTHCNEQWSQGCGWNYWKCSLHSRPVDPNK